MSGSEIMDEFEDRTKWRPSSGSVYPLLSRLHEKGFIKRLQSEEVYLKRFTLTQQGRNLLKEYEMQRGDLQKRFFSTRLLGLNLIQDNIQMFGASIRLLQAVEDLRPHLEKGENFEELAEAERILNEAAAGIEGIKVKLEEKGSGE